MKVTLSLDLVAADVEARTITGVVVPYDTTGTPNIGQVQFRKGSLNIANPADVLLFSEHDMTKPLGRGLEFADNESGTALIGKFKVANTTAGTDHLIEAAEGLRTGLSVGANVKEYELIDNVYHIDAADVVEVSLVSRPAFKDSQIQKVAASESETETTEPSADGAETTNEEEIVDETTTPAETPEKVEAAAAPSQTVGVAYTAPRVNLDITASEYMATFIKAQRGDENANMVVRAAVAQDVLADNIGVIPQRYMTEILNNGIVDGRRPFIDRITRMALPSGGQKFLIPNWVTAPSAAVTAENVQFSSTATDIDNIEVTKEKIGSVNNVSLEVLEFSDPSYLEQLISAQIAAIYQEQDTVAIAAALAGAGASGGTGYVAAISDGIADSGAVLRRDPSLLLCGSTAFSGLRSAVDNSGRPLFNALGQAVNAAGLRLSNGDLDVLGLDAFVDYNAGSTDLAVLHSDSVRWYENGSPVTIRLAYASNGSLDVAAYAWHGIAVAAPTSVREITVS
jgi:HK97 family phage prohead protease